MSSVNAKSSLFHSSSPAAQQSSPLLAAADRHVQQSSVVMPVPLQPSLARSVTKKSSEVTGTLASGQRVWTPQAIVRNAVLVLLFLVFGIGNNVGASMQGYVMPTFPSWLLYFTTVLYTAGFCLLALYRGENPFSAAELSRVKVKQYVWCAVWTALNGLLFQFSNVWVDGDLQQVLVNLQVPFTFAAAYWYFPDRRHTTALEKAGYGVVMAGIVVGMIPSFQSMASGSQSHESNQWYWVLTFIAAGVFGALQEVQQDFAFEPHGPACKKATMLFYFNLMSLPAYLVTIPCEAVAYLNGTTQSTSVADAFANQKRAFLCYANHPTQEDVDAGNCLPLSWLWPTVFVGAYVGFFFLYAVLITEFGVVMATVIGALVPILAAAVFDSAAIVGDANYRPFQWELGVSFAIILIGIAVKSWAQYQEEQAKAEAERRTADTAADAAGPYSSSKSESQGMTVVVRDERGNFTPVSAGGSGGGVSATANGGSGWHHTAGPYTAAHSSTAAAPPEY